MKPLLPGLSGIKWVILPLLVVAAIYYARLYRIDAKRLRPTQKRILWTLRTLAGVLVLAMLLYPAVQLVTTQEKLPVAVLLLDESTSMNYPEAAGQELAAGLDKSARSRFNTALEALDELQQELSKTHNVKVFTFSDTAQLARDIPFRGPDGQPLSRQQLLESIRAAKGDYTEAGDAVLAALDQLPQEKVSSVLLLSDGRVTGGVDYQQSAARAAGRTRVSTLAFGSEEPLCDLRIDRVDAPAEASLGDIMSVFVQITNNVRPDLRVKLTMLENDQVDQEKTLILKKGRNDVALSTIPRVEGLRQYRLTLPEQHEPEDEINYANNQAEFAVKVVKRTLRVLFVAGKATREYEHATLCMLRDPVVRLSCYLQSAHVDYVQQGNVVIDRLPKTVEQWREYDVIILYDIDPKDINSQQISGLENTVSKGAGLMVVAGRNYGLGPLLQSHGIKLRQMLPVEIDKNRPPRWEQVYNQPIRVERTPEAKGSAVFRLMANDQLNEQIWASFPSLYWYHPVVQVKPSATMVLRKTQGPAYTEDYGDCIMAQQRFQEGLVVYLGTDETWRWRNPFGSYDYDLFWSHLIRYLGETRLLGEQKQVNLSVDKPVYAPGEKARISLQVQDPSLLQQLASERLSATIIDPNQAKQVVPLQRDPTGRPVYVGTFATRHTGQHVVEASHTLSTADTESKPLFSAKEPFKVEMVPLETVDTTADLEGMARLAKDTGGTFLDHRNMGRQSIRDLAASIPADKLVIQQEIVRDVWDGWIALALVLALLTTEWTLRKLWGVL